MTDTITNEQWAEHDKWRVGVVYRGYRLYVMPNSGDTLIYAGSSLIDTVSSEEAARKQIDEWKVAP